MKTPSAILMILTLCFANAMNSTHAYESSFSLIYNDGQLGKIFLSDLSFSKSKVIYENTVPTTIGSFSKGVGSTFFFEECHIGKAICVIQQLDLATGTVTTVFRDGEMPTFIKEGNLLFFYKHLGKRQYALVSVDLNQQDTFKQMIVAPPRSLYRRETVSVVAMPEQKVVFLHKNGKLAVYDIASKVTKLTKFDGIFPKVWRSKTNTLIAKSRGKNRETVEINFKTQQMKRLSDLNKISGFIYFAEEDTLIFAQTRFKWWVFIQSLHMEDRSVYQKNLSTGKEKMLLKSSYLRSGIVLK